MYARAVLIETERLRLRPMESGDLDAFVALYADPEVTEFIRPLDRAAAEERLRRDESEWRERGHGLLAMLDGESGAFLGRCGLKHWPQFNETELGWVLQRGAWNHGYATEAARACAEWGFAELDVPYLTAMVNPDNVRSIRVAEHLGMTPMRDDVLLGDPVVVYGIDRQTDVDAGRHRCRGESLVQCRGNCASPRQLDAPRSLVRAPWRRRSTCLWVASVSSAISA
jgi:RimJ/RimL family protein N-acetyltransferase